MPEIDHLYMSVCQAMTGRGGWPLTVVMSPKKNLFLLELTSRKQEEEINQV